jgi:hypothetical protein
MTAKSYKLPLFKPEGFKSIAYAGFNGFNAYLYIGPLKTAVN